ncbi:DUF6049 family protein [Streptomyces tsukubensis]|uniref:Uncharacterized protein n=1 Tax=Streptomyces tsukubensis TaxID=83656 RepID=A0A1V4A8N6_9ACTN|nr:DUF6049 family protein [Streptomyces tsukubensis]OON79261.1 hypothetical protein B1H18_15020 [Streptomyces tsukubensis]QFR94619.1 hypothetical protein GBW32_18175 [Streptomyces tsukubensis]
MAEAAQFPGTRPSPARRWLRRAAALTAGVPLLAGLVQLPAAHASTGSVKAATSDVTGSRTVDVSVDSLTPAAPVPGDTLTVSGSVTNKSKKQVTDAHVALRVGPMLSGRSAIDNAAHRSGYTPGADGTEVGGKYTEKFAKLAPGITQKFSMTIPVKQLQLGSDGVYQIGVSLAGRTTAAPWQEQVLGIKRTFLPWQSEPTARQTRTSYLWPLISTTHLTAENASDEQQTPLFENDSLAQEITPGGRLERLVTLGKDLDITWVVDPDLLASVDAMTGSYNVQNAKGKPTPGRNQDVAKQFLKSLTEAVKGKKIVTLPFADPDLASIAQNGRNVSGSLSNLKDATQVAPVTVQTILHVRPSTDFAWPVEGAIDPSIVDVATSAGARKVIAGSDSVQESASLPYTPSAARPIGGGTTAVVSDSRLSNAFKGDMTRAENSTLAVQAFLAQSLMITRQDEERQRSIVVAPQRMPTASQAETMATALHALDDERWSLPQSLDSAADTKPDPDAATRVPGAGSYPAALRKQALPHAAFEAIRGTQEKLDGFKAVLDAPKRVVTPFGRAMERETSTSWRGRPVEADRYRQSVTSYLNELTRQVQLIEKTEAKLSGRSATIPVTVQNNLFQGVRHLRLRLTSTNPTRLKIGDGPYSEQPVKISSGHSQSVKFTTNANANGPVTVKAQLYTEDGQAYGSPILFDVKVTEVTITVMFVIAGGVLLLVLAGLRMYTQRKRAASRGPGDGGTDDGEGAGPGPGPRPDGEAGPGPAPDGPKQPSDPAPDTEPESTEASGTGERVDR